MRPVAAALLLGATVLARPARAQQPANPHVDLHGLACTACHTTSSWRQVSFDHRKTGTPLLGQHGVAPCSGCHDLRDFKTVAHECRFCHQDPHRGDAGVRCEHCHRETSWRQVSASDAHAGTRLPELGVHAALQCVDCHRQAGLQQFSGPVRRCVECHQTSFNATTNPSHPAMGFSVQCESCHQFTTWSFALFTQHDGIFPIYSGTHQGRWQSCATCHTTAADYKVFSCMNSGCHDQARTDSRHQGIPGYSYQATACLMCHPSGTGGSFTAHDAVFPIFSGTHAGRWTACTDCHTDPTNRQVFSCMTGACHPQSATDPGHSGIPGYAYTASQCFGCHPTGQAGNFTQHDALYFPIYSGTHQGQWSACLQCHPTPGQPAVYTCMSSGCHPQASTDQAHAGIPGYSYTATQCLSCHPTGLQGQFTQHDALFFPIYSGTHLNRWTTCAQCHPTAGQPAVYTCMSSGCHPQPQTDSNHSGVTGYQYLASACYSCHPTGTNP